MDIKDSALSTGLAELIDHLPYGVALVNGAGEVVFHNETSRAMLASVEPVASVGATATLSHKGFKRLGHLVQEARRNGGLSRGAVSWLSFSDIDLRLAVLLLPLTMPQAESTVAAILFDPETQPSLSRESLQGLYGLTRAEADVAYLMVRGNYSLKDIARKQGVSDNTVRTQTKNVYRKTSAGDRAELVRRILLGPSVWGSSGLR